MNSSDYSNLAAGNPPPGITSNFDNPPSRAIVEYIGVGICLGVTLGIVLLRIYVKLAVTRVWGWDDGACFFGFGAIIAYAGVNFSTTVSKTATDGKHIWDIKVIYYTKENLQCLIAGLAMYSSAALFVKLSLFLLYLRLFKPNKVTRWLIYGGILVNGLFYLITFVIYAAVLPPSPGQPDTDSSWLMHASKHDYIFKNIAIVQGIFAILSDIYLLVIPIRSVFQLNLPIRQKFGVSSIFLIGILAVSCSIASSIYRIKFRHAQDHSWSLPVLYTLIVAEICAGIICSCMPILKVLFGGKASHASPFATFAALFSRFSLRIFRQPSMSRQSHSFERLNPIPVKDHAKSKPNDSIKTDSGIRVTNSIEVV